MAKKTADDSAYASGFAVGIVAGLVGYLLFGTEKGSELRVSFRKKIDEVKSRLYEEGMIESTNISLPELIAVLQEQAQAIVDGLPKKKPVAGGKKRGKRFKGV
jgi:gas vesicle protein